MKQNYSTRLHRERARRGWSRNYVAEQVGVDVATVGRWERGERLPYPHYRQKLCTLFEMNAQDLGLLSESLEEVEYEAKVPTSDDPASSEMVLSTLESLASSEMVLSTLESQRPSTKEKNRPAKRLRQRRALLIGLLGVGAPTLLIGGIWEFTLRSRSPISSLSPLLSKHLVLHIDPNTRNVINNLAWSPDGKILVAANDEAALTLWNIEKGAILSYLPTSGQWVNDVTWTQSNRIAAASADGTHMTGAIQIWQFPETNTPIHTFPRTYPLRTVSWSPDGEYLAFAGHDTRVEIWGPISGSPTSRYLDAQSALAINRVKWSFDATYLAAATDSGAVYVWETTTGKLQTLYQMHTERVVDLDWSPGQYFIASASVDTTARVWDALHGTTRVTYTGHTGEVHGISWSPNGKYVVSGGYDTSAQVWDAWTGQHIMTDAEHQSSLVICVLWSLDGQTIAVSRKNQGVEICQASS